MYPNAAQVLECPVRSLLWPLGFLTRVKWAPCKYTILRTYTFVVVKCPQNDTYKYVYIYIYYIHRFLEGQVKHTSIHLESKENTRMRTAGFSPCSHLLLGLP